MQDKMLHDPHPLGALVGQISGSNAGSKSLVKFMGQINGSNYWSNLPVKFLVQIPRSNCWVKLLGYVTPNVTPVTRDVTEKHAIKRIQS